VTDVVVAAMLAAPVLAAAVCALPGSDRHVDRRNVITAPLVAGLALVVAIGGLTADGAQHGAWYLVDPAGGAFLAVIATVGLLSALASPAYLAGAAAGFFAHRRARRAYYVAFHLFWAALLAVATVDNLAAAWLLVEATTAASALLVAFSGRPSALEAGWKYLVLTTLGLAVALLGIVVLYAGLGAGHGSLATLDWPTVRALAPGIDPDAGVLALVLILGGLAAKVGWAPVHNWLPDAHSEAPPPVSAMLSAALLPTVMLVAWRVQVALRPATGDAAAGLFLAFGLASLAVAVPFLWRTLPLKRLLAYSSLEHMGILALGIGFGGPLATAGVVVHVAGHALAKSLGFYATIPLLRGEPQLARRPARALGATNAASATALTVALVSLSGLPPSPLFFSELLILLGGIAAGKIVVVALAAGLLALGFLGLTHALIEGVVAERQGSMRADLRRRPRLVALTAACTVLLLALSASAFAIAGSAPIDRLMGGVG